ncbi:MAG: nucleoside deaminase [Lachnospirales bacterium]
MDYEKYMAYALKQAEIAYSNNEVPIGCVIVYDDKIIGKGANMRVTKGNVLAHAEIIAINEACNFLGDWRLEDCTLFVTVEPCPMCSGAILQARIPTVVFGTRNPKAGCVGSIYNLLQDDRFNHKAEIIEGIMAEESAAIMKDFFKRFRK